MTPEILELSGMLSTGDFLDLLFKDAIEQVDRKIAESATVTSARIQHFMLRSPCASKSSRSVEQKLAT
jgi:hypothetical protein